MVLEVSEQAWLDVPRRGIHRNANGKESHIETMIGFESHRFESISDYQVRLWSWANRDCRRNGSQKQIMSFLAEAVSAVRRSGVAEEDQVRSLRRNVNSLV